MLTLGTTGAGIAYAMSGPKKEKEQGPSINASSKEEEDFILFVHSLVQRWPMAWAITESMRREFLKKNGGEQKV